MHDRNWYIKYTVLFFTCLEGLRCGYFSLSGFLHLSTRYLYTNTTRSLRGTHACLWLDTSRQKPLGLDVAR